MPFDVFRRRQPDLSPNPPVISVADLPVFSGVDVSLASPAEITQTALTVKDQVINSLMNLVAALRVEKTIDQAKLRLAFQHFLPSRDGGWNYDPDYHIFHPEDIIFMERQQNKIGPGEEEAANRFKTIFDQVESTGQVLPIEELKQLFYEYSSTPTYLLRISGFENKAEAGFILSRADMLVHQKVVQFLCGVMAHSFIVKLAKGEVGENIGRYVKAYEFWKENYNSLNKA